MCVRVHSKYSSFRSSFIFLFISERACDFNFTRIMLKIYFGGVVTVVAVILIPKVYSQDADTSFKNEDDFDYDQSFRNPG